MFAGKPTLLSSWESFSLLGEGKLAKALNRIAHKFSPASFQTVAFESDLEGIRPAADFYLKECFQNRAADFFQPPSGLPDVRFSDPCPLSHGEVLDIAFETSFTPQYPPLAAEQQQCCDNRTAFARVWRHTDGKSLGTLIAIHGWLMGDSRLSAVTLVPGFFFRLGLDVVLYELPYHGRRAPSCDPRSSLFPSFNLARTNEGFAQAIFELRCLKSWLRAESERPLGVMGLSLGGYTAALWTGLDSLAFAIAISPLVSMAEIAASFLDGEHFCRGKGRVSVPKLTPDELRGIYAVHCPLTYQPLVPVAKRMIVAGAGDEMVGPDQAKMLWQHWRKPRIEWLAGGHLNQVVEPHTLHHVHEFLLSQGMALEQPLDIRPIC